MKNKKIETLEQLWSNTGVLETVLGIFRKEKRSVVLGKSFFGKVSLEADGFFFVSVIYRRKKLSSPAEVFKALSKVKDPSSPTRDKIVSFIFCDVLQIKHHKNPKRSKGRDPILSG